MGLTAERELAPRQPLDGSGGRFPTQEYTSWQTRFA